MNSTPPQFDRRNDSTINRTMFADDIHSSLLSYKQNFPTVSYSRFSSYHSVFWCECHYSPRGDESIHRRKSWLLLQESQTAGGNIHQLLSVTAIQCFVEKSKCSKSVRSKWMMNVFLNSLNTAPSLCRFHAKVHTINTEVLIKIRSEPNYSTTT